MKLFSSQHDFDYDSSEVSKANWLKYSPWNRECNHVIAVDTLSRTLNPQSGVVSGSGREDQAKTSVS